MPNLDEGPRPQRKRGRMTAPGFSSKNNLDFPQQNEYAITWQVSEQFVGILSNFTISSNGHR